MVLSAIDHIDFAMPQDFVLSRASRCLPSACGHEHVIATSPFRRRATSGPRHETADPMAVQRRTVLQFMALYVVLFSAFGCTSPFLPAFLAGRGLEPEELGLVLGAATALRLVCGPIAGRLADRLQAFRTELAVCAILARPPSCVST